MKKLKYLIMVLLITQSLAFAGYHDILIGDIQYDWINKTDLERESIINEVRDIIFEDDEIVKQKKFRSRFKDKLKDKNYLENYFAASAGYEEYKDNNISAFYYKNQKHIYMYALQNKKDISKNYYYDALGHLKYVDFIYGEYPDYPYYSIQYKINGSPVSAIYYVAKDTQYLYEPDGTFKGVWYKHNLYDGHSKIILKRTAY